MDLGKNSISKTTNAIDILRAFFANVGLLTLFNIFLFQFCLKSSQTCPRSKLMVSFVGNLLAMNNLSVIKKLPFFSSQKVQFLSGYPY